MFIDFSFPLIPQLYYCNISLEKKSKNVNDVLIFNAKVYSNNIQYTSILIHYLRNK